ncbi:unnamed protein product [Calypogeia fissa]
MAGGSSQHQARHGLSAICRLVASTWRRSSVSSSVAPVNPLGHRGYATTGFSKDDEDDDGTNDEFWVVEGDILRIKGGHNEQNKLKMAVRPPPSKNLNLSRKQVAKTRHERVMATLISKSETGQEVYWKTYLKRYQSVRDQWEKLYFDEVPKVVKPPPKPADRNDPFTILGLKRRDKPYSPIELKSAYREMALKYHPDNYPGNQNAEARFEKIWNAYKMLQHKRSWR